MAEKNFPSNIEMLTSIPRSSVADDLMSQIKNLIISGQLGPGAMLPSEIEISQRVGVGRSTVREALRVLSTMGWITRSKRGTFVAETLSSDSLPFRDVLEMVQLKDVLELRLMLEGEVSYLAAQRAIDEDIARLSESLNEMKAALSDLPRFISADAKFHVYLSAATQNHLVSRVVDMIRDALEEFIRDVLIQHPEMPARALAYHERILKAIVSEDPAEARRATLEHISDIARAIEVRQPREGM